MQLAETPRDWWGRFSDLVPHAPILLGLLGLAVYVFVRVGYVRFYGTLNLQPEDVGVNYLLIMTTEAVAGIGVLAAYAGMVVIFAARLRNHDSLVSMK